ncbi:MAG: hypothetical protein AB7T49_17620 [Oligoflexales bacterium]
MSPGYDHTCLLDDSGVKCWGYSNNGQTNAPLLKNPKLIEAGGGIGYVHTCALDDTGVVCWGDNTYGEIDVPQVLKR